MANILITRPKKDSINLVKNLSAQGHNIEQEALFSVKNLKISSLNQLEKERLQSIIITSSNAIHALRKIGINKDILILAIGQQTGEKVKESGYKNVLYAQNSSSHLLEIITQKLSPKKGLILYLSGQLVTIDFAKKLTELGFEARRIVAYEILERQQFSKRIIGKIKNKQIDQITIYSKNTALILYKLATKHNLLEDFKNINLACFSQKISKYCTILGFKTNDQIL